MCKDQDKELLKSFLNRTFFRDFKDNKIEAPHSKLFNNLEFQLNSKCNLNCIYCYYNHTKGFGKGLNPSSISKDDNLRDNSSAILKYLTDNGMYPQRIDIFGGEPLNQSITYEIIDKVIEFYSNGNQKGRISIPTNMSFLRNEKLMNKVIYYKQKAKDNNVHLGISASVDGKYMDVDNRPVIKAKNQETFYNDEFYDKLFSFARDYGCGFHPMIHYNNIEKWKDNFLWFQDNFEKYNLQWNNIYLLEVRNDGWDKNSIYHFIDFYNFLLNYVFDRLDRDRYKFINSFVFNGAEGYDNINKMNLFNNIGRHGRGVGCSIQTTMQLRLGDLTVTPCHRQSYDAFNGFKFIKKDNEIVDIEPLNLHYYLATMSTDRKSWPYCENCIIRDICMSGCMGAQLEATGDPFTPIPSVCLLEFGKVKAQIDFLDSNNMFEMFRDKLPDEQATAFEQFKRIKKEK